MTAAETLAQRTIDLMPMVEHVSGDYQDVILTITIVMLIVKLVVIAYECWKNHHAPESIVWKPNFIQRLYLRRVIRRVLKEHGMADRTGDVMTALLAAAKASTVEDIQQIFEEARKDPTLWGSARSLGLVK